MSFLKVKLQLINYRIKRMAPRIVRENIRSSGYKVESLEHYMKVTDGKWVRYYPYSKRHRDPMLQRGIYCIEEGPGYSRVYRETTKSRSKKPTTKQTRNRKAA